MYAKRIQKSFDQQPVLKNISLIAWQGEFLTLLGPSGCGKTTLLRIIAGLEVPDSGDVTICGRKMNTLPANKRPVNTVFQNYALFPHLSVFENIAFGLRSLRVANNDVQVRCMKAVQMLQLEPYIKRRPHELSGGQKQRVALARALVNEPEVLLLDEPMSALDAKLRGEVQIELRRLQQSLGKTFILVTHDQDEAMTVSDRIVLMREGRVEQAGTPSKIYDHPHNRFVAEFLGSANLIEAAKRDSDDGMDTPLGALRILKQPLWNKGTLAIRPERIRIVSEQPAENGLRAKVKEIIYRGDHVDLFMDCAGLRVRTNATHGIAVGDEVWLELSPEHLGVLED